MTQRVSDEQLVWRRAEGAGWCTEQMFEAICADLYDERQARRAAEAQLKTVLDREAESQRRHDAKLAECEAVVQAAQDILDSFPDWAIDHDAGPNSWTVLADALAKLKESDAMTDYDAIARKLEREFFPPADPNQTRPCRPWVVTHIADALRAAYARGYEAGQRDMLERILSEPLDPTSRTWIRAIPIKGADHG